MIYVGDNLCLKELTKMSHIRKSSVQFDRIEDLITELENSGHSKASLWYSGALTNGTPDKRYPVAIISADCRMIAQKRSDGTWVALYGYDDPVSSTGFAPADAFNLEEIWFQLLTVQLLVGRKTGK
ncbi:hypothetical protein SMX44_003594 [Cronobacter sakazakii]|nr:hypothetical protein [Cronobacter sakazakii]